MKFAQFHASKSSAFCLGLTFTFSRCPILEWRFAYWWGWIDFFRN